LARALRRVQIATLPERFSGLFRRWRRGSFGCAESPSRSRRTARKHLHRGSVQPSHPEKVIQGAKTFTTFRGQRHAGFSGTAARDGGPRSTRPLGYGDQRERLHRHVGNQRIRKSTQCNISTVGGTGSGWLLRRWRPAIQAAFNNPVRVATDARANLYIADQNQPSG